MPPISQMFERSDYLMSLPMMLLTIFALGILLIDLMLPTEWKWANALTAFVGVLFAAFGVFRIQQALERAHQPGRAAAVDKPDARLGEDLAEPHRRRDVGRVGSGARTAIDANLANLAHGRHVAGRVGERQAAGAAAPERRQNVGKCRRT